MPRRDPRRMGRVFCVTGYSGTPCSSVSIETASSTKSSHCDTDSNTSGYLSSSSFESSGEEKRLVLNEQKVFKLWEKLDERKQKSCQGKGPRNSTPKQNESQSKSRISGDLDVLKCSLVDSQYRTKSDSNVACDRTFDSFWDIETTNIMYKSMSENDVRRERVSADENRRPASTHCERDAGSKIDFSVNCSNQQAWKRKPFQTLSNASSDLDLRLSGCSSNSGTNSSDYQSLPRYRVKVDEHVDEALTKKLTRSWADFIDEGTPVDESMSEFLANVDKDNLACFLDFYDRVTSTADYERARRNPRNYEAVYY